MGRRERFQPFPPAHFPGPLPFSDMRDNLPIRGEHLKSSGEADLVVALADTAERSRPGPAARAVSTIRMRM
jgi:hypothetical protein